MTKYARTPASTPHTNTTTQDRKTLAKLSTGAVRLEQNFAKQSKAIQDQRDNLQTQLENRREQFDTFIENLKAEYDAKVSAEKKLLDQFLQDTQTESERLGDAQHLLDKDS